MTRTERAAYPRAINRDRSSSRSGLDNSIRKNGAGGHNWGSIADERQLETAGMDDEIAEENLSAEPTVAPTEPESLKRSTSGGLTDEELEKARKIRKHAFKKNEHLDLATIARTSAAATTGSSPPKSALDLPIF